MPERCAALPTTPSRRLDQWLWFARLAKSRSLAARLCAAGAVAVNGRPVTKAGHLVRTGDAVSIPQGQFRRLVRVEALGTRRGPAAEARQLYEEPWAPVPLRLPIEWMPLLAEPADHDASD